MEWWVVVKVAVILVLCVVIKASSSSSSSDGLNENEDHHKFSLHMSSLIPPHYNNNNNNEDDASIISCSPSTPPVKRKGASLEVRHKHGPCSAHKLVDKSESVTPPSHVEILEQDEARVQTIRQRVNSKAVVELDSVRHNKDVVLPAKPGSTIGSGNFIVTLGLGTPKKDLSLIFDTGSDFTWTQCEPCSKSCYKQQDPIFDPSKSTTYSNITCSSSLCSDVGSATSTSPGCSTSSTCIYGIQYGDSSFSVGYFAKDTLYLGPEDAVPNFYFGCGENNQGLFGGSAGLIGLGRNKLSVVSQTASTYGNVFSYCLPSTPTSTGHLTFGKGGTTSKAIQYTSLKSSSANPSFYFLDLQGITVGGRRLRISPTVFSTAETIIDSGTVISRLPPAAYTALRDAFRQQMSKYPSAQPLSILDTCYDFSKYPTISVPKISLLFSGRARWDIGATGIFYVRDVTQVCLAFAGNSDASDVGILGNVQQLTFDIVYDVAAGKLGFGPAGCN